jgi:hypothetical protein
MSSHVFLPRPVPGFGFGGQLASQAVHEPFVVVPVHPGAGDFLQVGQGADGAVTEWRPAAGAFGLVQPNGRFRQGVVISVADGPGRAGQPCQQQRLGEPDGVAIRRRCGEWRAR